MRVIVDQGACICSGQCVVAAPQVFDQRTEGLAVLRDRTPPPELHDAVRRAAAACPAVAIMVKQS